VTKYRLNTGRMIGKTALIRAFAEEALRAGKTVTIVHPDCIITLKPEVLEDG